MDPWSPSSRFGALRSVVRHWDGRIPLAPVGIVTSGYLLGRLREGVGGSPSEFLWSDRSGSSDGART